MSVLLTHGYFLAGDPGEAIIMKPYPPVGLLYLSAWLKKEGIECEVYDTTFRTLEEMEAFLEKKRPDIIGFYSTLMTKMNVLKILAFIKRNKILSGTRIIIGGPDARQNAGNYLQHGVDVVIPGEAEIPLTETIRFFNSDIKGDLSNNRGIIFMTPGGEVFETESPNHIDPRDLPFPFRESIDQSVYLDMWKAAHGYSSMIINSMRGCPYSCNWCSKSVFGNTCRRRDPENVVEEMIQLINTYHPDQLWFTDDVFTISREWIRKFASEVTNRRIMIPYECISRSDCLDDEILAMLKKSGCRKLWIGNESGSQKVIDLMNRKINVEQTISIIKEARKLKISTGTFIMIGYPGEEKADILKTADFIKRASPDEVTLGLAYPIKGTRFYSFIEKDFKNPFNWEISNEREIEFNKPFSPRFYRFAIRYLFNTAKSQNANSLVVKLISKLKASLAKIYIMTLN